MPTTITIYKRNELVQFRKRAGGKIYNGRVEARWAPGEGDGYCIASADEYYDVPASRIVGPQSKK
jgi:hypothetical protein